MRALSLRMITSMAALYAMAMVVAVLPPITAGHPLGLKKSNHIFMVAEEEGGDGLIESTCRNTPNYQLCVATLQSDPRSHGADVYGLGLVLVDAVKKKATLTVENINKLKGSNPDFILPLLKCHMLYNAILKADIPEAVEALTKGVPKFAESGMDDTALEVEICEGSFKQSNSPLSAMNKDVYDLSLVAKSVIRMLL